MTSPRRFEQDLPALLADTYLAGIPDYRDDLVQQVARVRQRPAWTFPGRWLPMEIVTTRVPTTRLPLRQLAVLAIIAAILAATAAVYIGSRQDPVPAPFGIAANGLVAYDDAGDIFTVDPSTGASTAIVTGKAMDSTPVFSRDGTRLAFARQTGAGLALYAARADGTGLMPLAEPMPGIADIAFSPDGRQVLFTAGAEEQAELWLAAADGSGARQLDVGMAVVDPSFRPPDGAEVVFAGAAPLERGTALYGVDVVSAKVREILPAKAGTGRDLIRVSPDGSRIAYSASTKDIDHNTYQVHVVAADGTGDVTLPMPAGAVFQDGPAWSNSGSALAIARGYGNYNEDMVLAVVPADGSSVGVETEHMLTGCCGTSYEWSPDDTAILIKPIDGSGNAKQQLLWDPGTGSTREAPWRTDSEPAWQRLAG